jgi:molybdopterin synthase sulfur carrier subunit
MELELRFFATFREAAGGKTVNAEFADGSSVGDVLRELESEYEGMEGRLIVDGDLAPQINVLKNGREVLHLDGLDTPMADGDRLSVFPPVAGGTGEDASAVADGGDTNTAEADGADTSAAEADATDLPPAEEGWERRTVAYRGISRRLAAHYLRNLGGELVGTDDPAAATRVDGDGWRVTLSAEKVTAAAAIKLTEVTAEFAGDPEVLAELLPKYRQKAMRAGG